MGFVEILLAQIYAAPIFYSLVVVTISMVAMAIRMSSMSKEPNPFEKDARRKRKPLNFSKEHSDSVLKQGFAQKKVPNNLDAIVIGSGIGGLSTAAILAKANKRVLVLEQHDQAGGCCHTFTEKGFEFDVGIHYVGKLQRASSKRTLLDQISYGQIQWQALDENYDTVVLGKGDSQKVVHIKSGDQFRQSLVDAFPDETAAIDRFIADLDVIERSSIGLALLKCLPMWLSKLLDRTGILDTFISYSKYMSLSTKQYMDSITDNSYLKAVLSYSYGDYGTEPGQSTVLMNAAVCNHFKTGSGYPVGGASQIALNIIPVIEEAGGRVLVRAKVTDIITEDGTAVGVRVSKGLQEAVEIYAPIIISGAGVLNTKAMLPKPVFDKSTLSSLISDRVVQNGHGAISMFVGLNGSTESLGVKAQNIWAFTEADLTAGFKRMTRSRDQLDLDNIGDITVLFISFPSAKDPSWKERNPEKTTLTAITVVNYEWFEPWANEQVKHRGADYVELKNAIGQQMWSQILELYPQLEGKVEYFEVGSPLTNDYYIGANRGEMYGLDHNLSRFSSDATMKLRPDIGIPGLYLTGQDLVTCGFTGALTGGLLTASVILKRNLYSDCEKLHNRLIKEGTALDLA